MCVPGGWLILSIIHFADSFINHKKFFKQLKAVLAADGKILIAEPKMHVTAEAFERISDIAQSCGLQFIESPNIYFSRQ